MSEFDEESVLAMKIDPKDSCLLAGDTAGFIAIFDIKDYCISPQSTVSEFLYYYLLFIMLTSQLFRARIIYTLTLDKNIMYVGNVLDI